mmetsp:Transcript_4118/g.6194  ORF Transcript_4118/g.6194 Transcript_4118/m.6194 type:complete len:1216 (+) Transcript_4118:359-4006(+)
MKLLPFHSALQQRKRQKQKLPRRHVSVPTSNLPLLLLHAKKQSTQKKVVRSRITTTTAATLTPRALLAKRKTTYRPNSKLLTRSRLSNTSTLRKTTRSKRVVSKMNADFCSRILSESRGLLMSGAAAHNGNEVNNFAQFTEVKKSQPKRVLGSGQSGGSRLPALGAAPAAAAESVEERAVVAQNSTSDSSSVAATNTPKPKVSFSFDTTASTTATTTPKAAASSASFFSSSTATVSVSTPIVPAPSTPLAMSSETSSTPSAKPRTNKYVGTPIPPKSIYKKDFSEDEEDDDDDENEFAFTPQKRMLADHITDEVEYELGLEESTITQSASTNSAHKSVVRFAMSMASPFVEKEEKKKRGSLKRQGTPFPKKKSDGDENSAIPFQFMPGGGASPMPSKAFEFGNDVSKKEDTAKTETSSEDSKPSTTPSTPKATITTTSGWGKLFAPKPGEWKCDVCLCKNPKEATQCLSCETPKPASIEDGDSKMPAEDKKEETKKSNGAISSSAFSFGAPAANDSNSGISSGGFSFGAASSSKTEEKKDSSTAAAAPAFSFGTSTSTAAFAKSESTTTESSSAPKTTGFTFGAASTKTDLSSSSSGGSSFVFGAKPKPLPVPTTESSSPKPESSSAPTGSGFVFGATPKPLPVPTATSGDTKKEEEAKPPSGFSFGASSASTTPADTSTTKSAAPAFSFGAAAPAKSDKTPTKKEEEPKSESKLSASAKPFAFGSSASSASSAPAPAPSAGAAFSFGASSSTTPAPATSGGGSSAAPGFSFGASSSTTSAPPATSAGFSFGASSSSSSSADAITADGRYQRPIYVAATKQHVGKTSVSLALVSGLKKRFGKVGFIKPVGQQHVTVKSKELGENIKVDKDVCLVREHFDLHHVDYNDMSPVIIPRGYTKKYIDGKITYESQMNDIDRAFRRVSSNSDVVLCEGTGHVAVGSIVNVNNAKVASAVGADMVLVANGGLGSAFDELELNRVLCQHYNVRIAGVVINKVRHDKYEQTKNYMTKALMQRWGVPLLGCVPDRPYLGCPALYDLEKVFNVDLMVGAKHRFRHYSVDDINLITTSLTRFLENLRSKPSRTLYICHITRDDIILGFMAEYQRRMKSNGAEPPLEAALIVCGRKDKYPVSKEILDMIMGLDGAPCMIVECSTHEAMSKIHSYTPKLNIDDKARVNTAVEHYEPYIDFDQLLKRTTSSNSSFNDPDGISYDELRRL